jgi:hypothetical protein
MGGKEDVKATEGIVDTDWQSESELDENSEAMQVDQQVDDVRRRRVSNTDTEMISEREKSDKEEEDDHDEDGSEEGTEPEKLEKDEHGEESEEESEDEEKTSRR